MATKLSLKHGFITNVSSAVIAIDPSYKKVEPEEYYPMASFEVTSRDVGVSDFVSLHDVPFLRGSTLTIEESIDNLFGTKFHDRVTSFAIHGSSCWTFFEHPHFEGRNETFRPGKYRSSLKLGIFFKNIGSIEKINHCPP